MVDPRLIVALTISGGALVKTKTFAKRRYLGDPLNALRIFSEKAVDEIMILDIDATTNSKPPQFDYLKKMARAANVPLCYGGGVKTVQQAKKIIGLGFEKVAISSAIRMPPITSPRGRYFWKPSRSSEKLISSIITTNKNRTATAPT